MSNKQLELEFEESTSKTKLIEELEKASKRIYDEHYIRIEKLLVVSNKIKEKWNALMDETNSYVKVHFPEMYRKNYEEKNKK